MLTNTQLLDLARNIVPADLVDAIVAEMTSSGKLSSETGKKLGKFNRLVRPALAKLG